MGQETYTFKLNPEKIRTHLVATLRDENDSERSFRDYILHEINPQRADYNRFFKTESQTPLDPNLILDNLTDVQHRATTTDVALAYKWIWDTYNFGYITEEKSDAILNNFGFELIHEFAQRDRCWVYMNQLSEFEWMNGLDDLDNCYDDGFYLYNHTLYARYLDYLLVLMSKVCLDKMYKNNDAHYTPEELTFLSSYKTDAQIEEQTDRALIAIRHENEEEDEHEFNNPNYSRSRTACHYYVAENMFHRIKDIQEKLADYQGKIFIYYSY